MQIDLTHPEFQAAIPLMQRIEAAGYEAYFVGGAVRDAMLGLPPHDVDIASSAYPAEIKQIFPKTVDTGIQHGTVMVLSHGKGYEVTTFRTESGYQDFRRPDHVTFVRSLEEDLRRRDFTVNALAVRHDGTVVDLFDGLTDLHDHVLRAVGNPHERFHEDALRMMRAVRFQSQLGFAIEPATLAAITDNAPLLAHVSVERIASEFTRLMLGLDRQAGLTNFIATGLFAHTPLLADQRRGLEQLAALPTTPLVDPAVAWTLIAHLLQLPVRRLMKAWKQANALADQVARAADLLAALPNPTPWQLYAAGADAVPVAATAWAMLNPAETAESPTQAYAALPIHAKDELAVTGADLMAAGFTPGPRLGRVLHALEQAVVAGELANTSEALMTAAQK
ncbi:CCA tRNA nucleotidyltransferase [Lacticaseibacillus parakribbianus]|uniref:CCA tRNA nucleotidyltransferase n=1 Tax=Lacticaseibacillus parakribbianus TaxID=2970927 RepID=UPI0021CB9508|nr:CCA tRNA nucleotidyltransferase [Lacticaseibacillus parakribbianus]